MRSRKAYKPKNDPTHRTPQEEPVEPDYKEVVVQGATDPVYTYVYTIPKLAIALNRTTATVKKWIAEGSIPRPIIRCTSRNYAHYSLGEYKLLRDFLRRRERSEGLQYLGISHAEDIERLHQRFEGYRKTNV